MYDAVIVGARCAGSPTAMLLARQGFKVLLVDKATFPSDTISTHILWPHGAEILARWGLLGSLAATGAPPICRHMTFDVGPFALRGAIPDTNDGMGGFCPRRTVLDSLLVHAAAEAGVDVREGFTVDELLEAGDSVVGVRGHGRDGGPVEEHARIVIGADGVHSFVARAVQAAEYDVRPVAACGYYSHFSDVRHDDIGTLDDGLAAYEGRATCAFDPCTSSPVSSRHSSPLRPRCGRSSARYAATKTPPTPFCLRSPAPFRCPISCRTRISAASWLPRRMEFHK